MPKTNKNSTIFVDKEGNAYNGMNINLPALNKPMWYRRIKNNLNFRGNVVRLLTWAKDMINKALKSLNS